MVSRPTAGFAINGTIDCREYVPVLEGIAMVLSNSLASEFLKTQALDEFKR
jgi:hypothetical protein